MAWWYHLSDHINELTSQITSGSLDNSVSQLQEVYQHILDWWNTFSATNFEHDPLFFQIKLSKVYLQHFNVSSNLNTIFYAECLITIGITSNAPQNLTHYPNTLFYNRQPEKKRRYFIRVNTAAAGPVEVIKHVRNPTIRGKYKIQCAHGTSSTAFVWTWHNHKYDMGELLMAVKIK